MVLVQHFQLLQTLTAWIINQQTLNLYVQNANLIIFNNLDRPNVFMDALFYVNNVKELILVNAAAAMIIVFFIIGIVFPKITSIMELDFRFM